MSDKHNLKSLFDRQLPSLIEEIEKEECSLSDLEASNAFKQFIDAITEHVVVDEHERDWRKNKDFLNLFNEINKQFTNEIEKMIAESKTVATGAKLAIAFGAIGLIGVAIGAYYVYKQNEKKRQNEQNQNRSIGSFVNNVVENGILGQQKEPTPVLQYKSHILLLVISANRLPKGLQRGKVDNSKINELIAGAARAYCFEVNNPIGNKTMNNVSCSNTPIDETTENRVFVQLKLSASPEITNQRNKLNIREMIEPNSNGELLQIQNLESARSASESTGFYKLL